MNLETILLADDVVKSINDNLDYLLFIIPEIKYMIGFEHKNLHHHLDVFNHTLLALKNSPRHFEIRICLLLHDIGKPFSYQIDGEVRHFKNHPIFSSLMARNILDRLGYDEYFINEVCYLIIKHDSKILQSEVDKNFLLEYKRFVIQKCDLFAHNPLEKDIQNKKYQMNLKLFNKM